MSYEALGDAPAAQRSFDRAIAIEPSNDAVRTARGLLNYGGDSASAVADFQIAVASHTPLVWPYYYLAHYFLTQANYRNCLAMCRQSQLRTDRADIRADLLEWSAIARHESGAPRQDVECLFTSARTLAPFNARITENILRFDQLAAARPAAGWRLGFDVPPDAAARALRSPLIDIRLDSQIVDSQSGQLASAI
jgi:hypothetical protein